jgi:hypothetical protein
MTKAPDPKDTRPVIAAPREPKDRPEQATASVLHPFPQRWMSPGLRDRLAA